MPYVLDTGFFIISRDYYPDIFPGFWESMKEAAENGILFSVREVKKEIENYGGPQEHLHNWIKSYINIFDAPTQGEVNRVREILGIPKFQHLIKQKDRLQDKPVADPFVIARAWEIGGTVVTRELLSKDEKAPNIPNVCSHFGVPCINPEEFMKQVGWRF